MPANTMRQADNGQESAELAAMRAELAAVKAQAAEANQRAAQAEAKAKAAAGKLAVSVSDTGRVCVKQGSGGFPMSADPGIWLAILDGEEILKEIRAACATAMPIRAAYMVSEEREANLAAMRTTRAQHAGKAVAK